MSRKHKIFFRSRERGLTLLEVVAAIAILGSLLVGLVMAKAAHTRQIAASRRQLEGARLADDLIASWWASGQPVQSGRTGTIGADGQWAWETRAVDNSEIEKLGARVVRVELRDSRSDRAAESDEAIVVELVLPGDLRKGRR